MSRLQAIAAWILGSLLALLLYVRWFLGLALAIALLGCAGKQPDKAAHYTISIPVTPECVKKIVCSAPDCKKAKITRLRTSACEVWEKAED